MLSCDVSSWLELGLRAEGLASLGWRAVGDGVEIATLARAGGARAAAYRVAAGAPEGAFDRHVHPGGELYLVVEGAIEDEQGRHPAGRLVWLEPGSEHTPRAVGPTVVLVIWPGGVEPAGGRSRGPGS